ncbi:hypothetical protein AV530_017548 [Patagioenas fasciata monilis]|uniref:Uncharacterized protein n=1 Tax=Patagioenas fasciata monilis TaxID=372326 RepID=A0A1V4JCW2_PATFA|nr:hypothetical protein AV530_017548 [Patagioenas fasciata monilis]
MTILYNSEVLLSSPQTGRIPDAVPSALPQGGVSSCEIKRVLKMSCWLRCLGKAVLAGLGGRVTVLIFLPPHPGCWRTVCISIHSALERHGQKAQLFVL